MVDTIEILNKKESPKKDVSKKDVSKKANENIEYDYDTDEVVHLGKVEDLTGGNMDGAWQDGASAPARWKM